MNLYGMCTMLTRACDGLTDSVKQHYIRLGNGDAWKNQALPRTGWRGYEIVGKISINVG